MAGPKTAKQTGFDVNIRHLHEALRLMLRFASTDPSFPAMNVVRWDTDGKRLIFTATDRYTIGRYTLSLPLDNESPAPKFDPMAMLTADVRRVLNYFKPERGIPKTVHVLPGPDGWEFSDNEVTFKVTPPDTALPPLQQIMEAALASAKQAEPMTTARGLDASFVARFHLGHSGGSPAVFWPAPPQKPILVTVTDEFMGVIMPVRVMRPSDEQLALIEAEFRTADSPVAMAS
jgi:hypothetical protein